MCLGLRLVPRYSDVWSAEKLRSQINRGPVPERRHRQRVTLPGQRERVGADPISCRTRSRTRFTLRAVGTDSDPLWGFPQLSAPKNWEKRCILVSFMGKESLTDPG